MGAPDVAMTEANAESFQNLRQNLAALKMDPDAIPLVVQFNKRDLPNVKPMSELEAAWKARGIPVHPATAIHGEGVLETLESLLRVTFRDLAKRLPLVKTLGLREDGFIDAVMSNFESPAGGPVPT